MEITEIPITDEIIKKPGKVIVAVVEDDEGKILLVRRKEGGGWAFPSGIGATTKYQETPEKAIHSEISYDTNLKIEADPEEILNTPIDGNVKVDGLIAYRCKVQKGQVVQLNPDSVDDYDWVEMNDNRLDKLPFDQPLVLGAYKRTLE